ncbi:hypothetical protein K443DRAFT_104169, partial [Laccaria amethystina LaAM-08-1]
IPTRSLTMLQQTVYETHLLWLVLCDPGLVWTPTYSLKTLLKTVYATDMFL